MHYQLFVGGVRVYMSIVPLVLQVTGTNTSGEFLVRHQYVETPIVMPWPHHVTCHMPHARTSRLDVQCLFLVFRINSEGNSEGKSDPYLRSGPHCHCCSTISMFRAAAFSRSKEQKGIVSSPFRWFPVM